MLTKLNLFVIFFPFISVIISSFIFLLFQHISNKNYLLNLLLAFFLILFLIFFIIYKFRFIFNSIDIFYLIFVYLNNFFFFMVILQAQVSSLQLTILRIIKLNPNIKKNQLIKKYNANNMFEERIKRLLANGIIYKTKQNFYIKNNYIKPYLDLTKILRYVFKSNN